MQGSDRIGLHAATENNTAANIDRVELLKSGRNNPIQRRDESSRGGEADGHRNEPSGRTAQVATDRLGLQRQLELEDPFLSLSKVPHRFDNRNDDDRKFKSNEKIPDIGISPRMDSATMNKYVGDPANRINGNLSRLWPQDSQILFAGEDHKNPAIKDKITSSLDDLKKNGLTHVGMEMLPEHLQPDIDIYTNPKATPQDVQAAGGRIREHLSVQWRDKFPGSDEKYMSVIDKAKSLGLKVTALESNDYAAGDSVSIEQRNRVWASTIDQTLKDYDSQHKDRPGRMLVLAGEGHVGHSLDGDNVNEKCTYARKPTVVTFAGEVSPADQIDSFSMTMSRLQQRRRDLTSKSLR